MKDKRWVDLLFQEKYPIIIPPPIPRVKIIPSNRVLSTSLEEDKMKKIDKEDVKKKASSVKTKIKDFVHRNKKNLIKGGIAAGVTAVVTGVVAVVVNRCGLPSDCDSGYYDEYEIKELTFDTEPEDIDEISNIEVVIEEE